MAFNLFQNILNSTKPSIPSATNASQFIQGRQAMQQPTQQAQPTPVQPKPQAQKMSLFSDEVIMLGNMKADGLDDEKAMSLIKQRRNDLLGGNTMIDDSERSMLEKMRADNLSAKEATRLIAQRRKDTEKKNFEKAYSEGNLLQKGAYNFLALGAGNLETTLKYGGNILDAATFGKAGFGEDVKAMQGVTQSPQFQESTAYKAGTYLPDAALTVSPIGGGYLAGAKGMGNLALRSGVVGAGFGAAQPILEKGSDATMGDIATGAGQGALLGAVATPVISKTLKYGQAGYHGGLTGMGKSIARDVKSGVNAITPSGANISTRANRFNDKEIRKFKRITGESPGEFATSRGMTKTGDDAVVEATTLWQKSKEQADDALTAIKGRFKFTGEKDILKTTLNDLETRLVNTESPDLARIQKLRAKYEDSGLTMSEINEVKRAYSNNYKYSFVDAGSEPALRSRNLQDAIRKWQFKVAEENGLTNLKDINKTTQGWKTFADSLSKKIQGSSANNAVSLTDWIALSGGSPENIAMYLGRKLASSDTVKQGAIKLFSKQTKPSIIQASKADILNSNFQKNVNRGVSGVGDNSGGKSLVRPVGLLPAPSGKATGAKNVRVNQPKETPAIKSDITTKSKIVRPGTKTKLQASVEKQLLDTKKRESFIRETKQDIASATKSARYGGTGNSRIEQAINSKLSAKKLTIEEARQIVEDIIEDVTTNGNRSVYSYTEKPKLLQYLESLYDNNTVKKLLNEEDMFSTPLEPSPKPIVKKEVNSNIGKYQIGSAYGDGYHILNSKGESVMKLGKIEGNRAKEILESINKGQTKIPSVKKDLSIPKDMQDIASIPDAYDTKVYRTDNAKELYKGKTVFGKGKYFSINESDAVKISKDKSAYSYELPKDLNLLEVKVSNNFYENGTKSEIWRNSFQKMIEDKGFDGAIIKVSNDPKFNLSGDQVVIYNTAKLKPSPTTTIKQDFLSNSESKLSDAELKSLAKSEKTGIIPKPIVKNLQKTEKSATMENMETKKLKKSKALRVYDVIKLKNNDITSVPFDDFYSLARASTKGMTKDKAWGLWMNKMLQKVEKGESVDIDILKKYPLAGVIIKDFLKTKINPFE